GHPGRRADGRAGRLPRVRHQGARPDPRPLAGIPGRRDGHPSTGQIVRLVTAWHGSVLYLLSGVGGASARISEEDMAYVEDLVPQEVPKAPCNPDPPRYLEWVPARPAVRVNVGAAEADVT